MTKILNSVVSGVSSWPDCSSHVPGEPFAAGVGVGTELGVAGDAEVGDAGGPDAWDPYAVRTVSAAPSSATTVGFVDCA
ncbi:hypothetical protein NHL51_03325 [Leucobacter sp. gxy201]|uniref:hypothetical protein n=1 Tax=Leucobacter sp. gxy201 TaxID=2957200 RepID=UPI003DA0B858